MSIKLGKVELFMGPRQLDGPDDLEAAIVTFIGGAKKRLDIAVQELDNKKIAKAIIKARQKKVTVRIVLESDYLRSKRLRIKPFDSGGEHEINRILHDAILRSNIKVNTDYNSKIFHQKFIIRDSKDLLTGSTNFTSTGTSANLNHIIIIKDKKVAILYTREFREIQQGHFGKLNEGHDEAPKEVTVSNLPMKVLFAPDHSPEMEIMKQMSKARKRIDFAIFTFSNSSGIDDVMISRCLAGISVRGALDLRQGKQVWSPGKAIKKAGGKLFLVPKKGTKVSKLHHKLMVIDKQVVVIGSFNYTGPANKLNDENIIVIGDLRSKNQSVKTAQKKIAKYALEEIDRIIEKFGKKL